MLARVFTCAVIGLEGVIVEVEVNTGSSPPSMIIVGQNWDYPDFIRGF